MGRPPGTIEGRSGGGSEEEAAEWNRGGDAEPTKGKEVEVFNNNYLVTSDIYT